MRRPGFLDDSPPKPKDALRVVPLRCTTAVYEGLVLLTNLLN
jgi:hypothetical protein